MESILVTGGAGYIGSHTVKELVAQGYNVIVLDNLEGGHRQAVDPAARLETADTKNKQDIITLLKKYSVDAIIDFAAYLDVGESMAVPDKYLKNNVLNFINILDAMVETGCKYIIKSSTAATYGNPIKENDIPWQERFTDEYKSDKSALLEGTINGQKMSGEDFYAYFINSYEDAVKDRPELELSEEEKTKLRIPMSIYGLSKLLDEILMEKYNKMHGISFVALRYFNVCGAHPDGTIGDDKPKPSNLMTVSMLNALGKIPELTIFGKDFDTKDGTGIRDYIHPCDLATGHIKALEYILAGNEPDVFNLGTGTGSSVLEVIAATEEASGRKLNIKDGPRRSGDPSISISNPSKANNTLGWKAKFSLKDMAKTAWNWHSTHPDGFAE